MTWRIVGHIFCTSSFAIWHNSCTGYGQATCLKTTTLIFVGFHECSVGSCTDHDARWGVHLAFCNLSWHTNTFMCPNKQKLQVVNSGERVALSRRTPRPIQRFLKHRFKYWLAYPELLNENEIKCGKPSCLYLNRSRERRLQKPFS